MLEGVVSRNILAGSESIMHNDACALTIFSYLFYLNVTHAFTLFIPLPRIITEPHSSVGSVADLRTGGHMFNPRLGKYSFLGLMILIAIGFIPLSPLSVVSTTVMLESSHWLGKNIVRSTGQKNSRKAWIDALASAI